MDWRLGLAALVMIPAFAGLFHGLTGWLGPLAGLVAGLVLYWLLAGGLALRALGAGERAALLAHARPPRALAVLAFLPVVVLAWLAMAALESGGFPPALLLVVALLALADGVTGELFWRGALLPAPDREGVAVAWVLFTAWHLVFLFARGVELGSGLALMAGAGVMGAVWMALRLRTGTLGPGIAAHVAFDLFAFAAVAARNWPAGG